MSNAVQGQTVLVTGGNRGIGKAIVESFLQHAAKKVYVAVRNVASANNLTNQYGDRVVAVEMDLTKPESIKSAAVHTGDVQIVVNNAGVLQAANLLQPEAFAAFQYEIDVNVYGFMHVAQNYTPILAKNGGGALVQLNSVASIKNFPDFATYAASKAASYSITQALREKLKSQNTFVMSVHPGPIATDMADAAGMTAMAEPASVVAEAIIRGLEQKQFHVFPDTMAKQFWAAYQSYGTGMIEATMTE